MVARSFCAWTRYLEGRANMNGSVGSERFALNDSAHGCAGPDQARFDGVRRGLGDLRHLRKSVVEPVAEDEHVAQRFWKPIQVSLELPRAPQVQLKAGGDGAVDVGFGEATRLSPSTVTCESHGFAQSDPGSPGLESAVSAESLGRPQYLKQRDLRRVLGVLTVS